MPFVVARRPWLILAAGACLAWSATAQTTTAPPAAEFKPQVGQAGKDVVWVPTPDEVVEKMLELTEVGPKDRVVDLGSGDGKIAIAAAKRGARAKGIEYNPQMVALSRRNAKEAGVKVDFVQGDIFKSNFREATVITMYLLPQLNERLAPTLLKMKPGTRIASHQFLMGDWKPDQTVNVDSRQVHFWRVPAQLEGNWQVQIGDGPGPQLQLRQSYQQLDGEAEWGGQRGTLQEAKIDGSRVSFAVADAQGVVQRFEGTVDAQGRLRGEVGAAGGAQKQAFSARRR